MVSTPASQAVLFRRSGPRHIRTRALAALTVLTGLLAGSPVAQADKPLGLGVEAGITTDNNVTRGYGTGNVLADQFVGVDISKSFHYPLFTHTRLVLLGSVGFNSYFEYSGLSHVHLGVQGNLQYRTSAGFYAPTFTFAVRSATEEYQSEVRDGYRSSVAVSVRKPVTDKLQLAGALAYNRRDAKSEVFDNNDVSVRLSADFAATSRDAIYLGLEYREGDIVSTGRSALAFVEIATAVVPDDAFEDTTRYAYKIDGSTRLLNLGYNRSFGERHALDLSWRSVYATPSPVAGTSVAAGRIRYTVNQLALAYLVRF